MSFDFLNVLKSAFLNTIRISVFLAAHILFGWLWLLNYIFRSGAIAVSKLVHPTIGRPLGPVDVFLLENYNERHVLSIVVTLTGEGEVSLDKILDTARSLLQAKREDDPSRLKYPELQQYQVNFLGFPFWKDDPDFRVENHIRQVTYGDEDTPEYFQSYESIVAELSGRPYPRRRCPWEIWIVRNFPQEDGSFKTVFVWRAHHSLGDAMSALSVLIDVVGGGRPTPALHIQKPNALLTKTTTANNNSRSTSSIVLLSVLRGYLKAGSEALQNRAAIKSISAARSNLGQPPISDNQAKAHFRYAPALPLDEVKRVAAHFGVRVPALLATLVADSVSNVVQADDLGDVFARYTFPLANHPGSVVNHILMSTLRLPMSRCQPVTEKLQAINTSFLELPSNPVIYFLMYSALILGKLPTRLARWVYSSPYFPTTPLLITNFAVGSTAAGFQVEGVDCLEMRGGFATRPNQSGSLATIVGYKSHVRICFAGYDALYSEEDVGRIALGIGETFEELRNQAISINNII